MSKEVARLVPSLPLTHGGAAGIRTRDLCRARAALSQLSYRPIDRLRPHQYTCSPTGFD